jgi:hypothetical protein
MRRVLSLLPVLVVALSLLSCATMARGTHEDISVNSSPSGANATLTCSKGETKSGVTPLAISIRRNAGECSLKVSKEGFAEETVAVEQGMNGRFWANFGFLPLVPIGVVTYAGGLGYSQPDNQGRQMGSAMVVAGLVPWAVDYWSGAMHEHSPTRVDLVLKPKN